MARRNGNWVKILNGVSKLGTATAPELAKKLDLDVHAVSQSLRYLFNAGKLAREQQFGTKRGLLYRYHVKRRRGRSAPTVDKRPTQVDLVLQGEPKKPNGTGIMLAVGKQYFESVDEAFSCYEKLGALFERITKL